MIYISVRQSLCHPYSIFSHLCMQCPTSYSYCQNFFYLLIIPFLPQLPHFHTIYNMWPRPSCHIPLPQPMPLILLPPSSINYLFSHLCAIVLIIHHILFIPYTIYPPLHVKKWHTLQTPRLQRVNSSQPFSKAHACKAHHCYPTIPIFCSRGPIKAQKVVGVRLLASEPPAQSHVRQW